MNLINKYCLLIVLIIITISLSGNGMMLTPPTNNTIITILEEDLEDSLIRRVKQSNDLIYVAADPLFSLLTACFGDMVAIAFPPKDTPSYRDMLNGIDIRLMMALINLAALREDMFPGSQLLKSLLNHGDVIIIRASVIFSNMGTENGMQEIRETIWEEKLHLEEDRLDWKTKQALIDIILNSNNEFIKKAREFYQNEIGSGPEITAGECLGWILVYLQDSEIRKSVIKDVFPPELQSIVNKIRVKSRPTQIEIEEICSLAEQLKNAAIGIPDYRSLIELSYKRKKRKHKDRGIDRSK